MRTLALALAMLVQDAGMGFAQNEPEQVADELALLDSVPAATAGRVSAAGLEVAVSGVRVFGAEDPVQINDAWHVGSLTKAMTATLAARLVEDRLISWDSTIGDVLGDSFPDMEVDWQEITLAQLLTHASGMDANLGRIRSILLGQGARHDYVAEVLSNQPQEAPGGFSYSNAGYVVAGAMLEAVGGDAWETLIAREVFEPLGMDSAGFGPPQGAALEGHRVRLVLGLTPAGQGHDADNIPAMGPAGRVHLSAEDMLRFLRAHALRDAEFLAEETWEQLHRATGPRDYAMGWGVREDGSLVHSGSNTLWYATAYVDPATEEAVFVAVNTGDLDAVSDQIAAAVRDLLSAQPD